MCALIYTQPLQIVRQSYFLIFGGFLDTQWLLFVFKRQKKKDWCSLNLIRGKTLVAPQLVSMETWYSRGPWYLGCQESRICLVWEFWVVTNYQNMGRGDPCQFQSKAGTEAVKYVCGKIENAFEIGKADYWMSCPAYFSRLSLYLYCFWAILQLCNCRQLIAMQMILVHRHANTFCLAERQLILSHPHGKTNFASSKQFHLIVSWDLHLCLLFGFSFGLLATSYWFPH